VYEAKVALIRSELPYAILGTLIGVIAGWSLFVYTQKLDRPAGPAMVTTSSAPVTARLVVPTSGADWQ
jgi:hypothetical protein